MPFTFSIGEYANMVLHTVLMSVMQFMPQLNTSNMPQTVEYQTEECLLKFTSIARHQYFLTYTLQLSVSLIKISMNNKILFRWYSVVPISKELQDILMFTHTRVWRTLLAPIPNAGSATAWTRQFWPEAGILQVTQWQSPDLSTLDYCVQQWTKEIVYSLCVRT